MSIENLIALLEELDTILSELFLNKFYLFSNINFPSKFYFIFFSKSNMKLLLLFKSFFHLSNKTILYNLFKTKFRFFGLQKRNLFYFKVMSIFFLFYKKGHE